MLGVAEEDGTVVPSTAMSEREPPLGLGSCEDMVACVFFCSFFRYGIVRS